MEQHEGKGRLYSVKDKYNAAVEAEEKAKHDATMKVEKVEKKPKTKRK